MTGHRGNAPLGDGPPTSAHVSHSDDTSMGQDGIAPGDAMQEQADAGQSVAGGTNAGHGLAGSSGTASNTTGQQATQWTPEQIAVWHAGRRHRRAIDKTIGVAGFNAWSTAIVAGLAVPFVAFSPSFEGVFVLVGLAWVAYQEFKGRRMLRALDEAGAKHLAINQLIFLGVICIYCAWSLVRVFQDSGRLSEIMSRVPQYAELIREMPHLPRYVGVALYVGVIVGTFIFQGGTAIYYITRRNHVRAYVHDTPQWVKDGIALQRGK